MNNMEHKPVYRIAVEFLDETTGESISRQTVPLGLDSLEVAVLTSNMMKNFLLYGGKRKFEETHYPEGYKEEVVPF